jgi:hypothetical protein
MYITITNIDKANPRDIKDFGGSVGYPVTFRCDFVEGSATLISSQTIESDLKILLTYETVTSHGQL